MNSSYSIRRRTTVRCLLASLGIVFFAAVCGMMTPAARAAAAAARPNVVLLLTDDQGYGDLSVHGNPILKTPQLDRLHGESIRLTDFHVAPMCTPTRGQLMTGVDALRNGAMNVSSGRTNLRREFPTMADIFSAQGYRTGIFGKWHLGDDYPYRPQDRGFHESIWFPSSHVSSAPDFFNNDYFDDTYIHNGTRQQFKGYCTDVFFREAMAWMRQRAERHESFLCYLPLNAPHGPLFGPERYREPYHAQKPNVARFFGMIACIDENVGRLEAFLRETGLRENTIFIFMTDNGTATGDSVYNAGMRGKKIGLYDGGHRVPFFLRWPAGKLRAPADIDALTQVQDVLPTLIDLCGLRPPANAKFDGTSLAGLLRGTTDTLRDRMIVSQFSRMNDPRPKPGDAVVMWKKWRLVTDKELYDLSTDRAQERNVIEQFPDIAARLRGHYAQWWAGVEPRVHEFSPIHIGSEHENPTLLTPCDWMDSFLDQQAQVRRQKKNGAWALFVERAGDYEIALRRWPIEADAPITAALPPHHGVDGTTAAGDAFPVASAEMKIGDVGQIRTVGTDDKAVTFNVRLKGGRTELQTWFRDADGREIAGAYYVYIRRVAGS
ncbi:MAG: arylsulfatase [Opitutaceae bacterium]|nr:arylsulfatase [Opitutaceae bacterium]